MTCNLKTQLAIQENQKWPPGDDALACHHSGNHLSTVLSLCLWKCEWLVPCGPYVVQVYFKNCFSIIQLIFFPKCSEYIALQLVEQRSQGVWVKAILNNFTIKFVHCFYSFLSISSCFFHINISYIFISYNILCIIFIGFFQILLTSHKMCKGFRR